MRSLRLICVAILLASCAPLATVKKVSPRIPEVAQATDPLLTETTGYLNEAQKSEHREPTRALAGYLAGARAASNELEREPNNESARVLYNFAVARCIKVIETAPLDPWTHSLTMAGPDGEYVLTTVRPSNRERNPADYNITPADELVIGGTYVKRRVTIDGIGAPVVAVGKEENPHFRETLTSRRLYGG